MTRTTTGLVGVRAQVIPANWEAHHIPTAEGGFTAVGDLLTGPGEYVYDPATKTEVRDYGTPIYTGPLRFQHIDRPNDRPAGGESVTTHDYRVSIPETVNDVEQINWVRIRKSSDESAQLLKVVGIIRGSLRWQRDLLATDNIG